MSKRQYIIQKSDPSASQTLRRNLQLECWRTTRELAAWPDVIADWLSGSDKRGADEWTAARRIAEAFLSEAAALSTDQVEAVSRSLHRDVQELIFDDWVSAEPGLVLRENVRRLLDNSGAPTKAELADRLEVSAATLSRWTGGQQEPDLRARRAIVSLFGLRSVEELEQVPLFLSYVPVTHAERVAWVQERVGEMRWDELRELFPALLRLLSPHLSKVLHRRPMK